MGKAHRRRRAEEKRLARWFGYREDEYGHLRKVASKAEARRRFILYAQYQQREFARMRRLAEKDIINMAVQKAHDELCQQMDREVFQGAHA